MPYAALLFLSAAQAYLDTLVAIHAALATPFRYRVQESISAVMPLFKGRVYHLIMGEGVPLRLAQ